MNTKKIISFISLFLISYSLLFSDVVDQTPSLDNSTFENQNKDQKYDAPNTKDLSTIKRTKLSDLNNTDKNKFYYLNLQTIYYYPEVGLGFRKKINNHGYDLNLAVDPLFSAIYKIPIGTFGASYLKYFSSNYYFGVGFTSMVPFVMFTSPNVSIGKQFEKFFFQLKLHYGVFFIERHFDFHFNKNTFLPCASVGFAF